MARAQIMEPQKNRCLQRLLNFWTFIALLFVSSAIGTVCFSYIITCVQSIERQFEIPSKLSGTLMAANDVGFLTTVIFLAYFGSRGNRIKWIASGFMMLSAGCLLIASPHVIFSGGIESNLSNADLFSDVNAIDVYENNVNMKHAIEWFEETNATIPFLNGSNPFGCPKSTENPFNEFTNVDLSAMNDKDIERLFDKSIIVSDTASVCRMKRYAASSLSTCNPVGNEVKRTIKNMDCETKQTNTLALTILFIGIVLIGAGTSMPWTLGMPLIDDAVKKRSAPLYFGCMVMVRILGPMAGFLLGAQLNGKWLTLSDPPQGMNEDDPRWIGAWWLGFIIVGILLLIPALPLMFFPIYVITDRNKAVEEKNDSDEIEMMLADGNEKQVERKKSTILSEANAFLTSVKSILKSKVFMGCLIGRLFDAFAFKGYFVFKPKFIETQFAVNMRVSNRLIGSLEVVSFILGTGIGGLLLRKFQLSGRKAAIMVLMTTITGTVAIFISSTIRCDSVISRVGQQEKVNGFNMTLPCNLDCNCEGTKVLPVCDKMGNVYFNPCYAGCVTTGSDTTPGDNNFKYQVCKCTEGEADVSKSYCQQDCRGPLITYFTISTVTGLIVGIGFIPSILIIMRSVKEADRSMALALSAFLTNLLSTLPSPIVYGFLVDGACVLRGETCAGPQTGSCEIYDADSFRLRFADLICQEIIGISE